MLVRNRASMSTYLLQIHEYLGKVFSIIEGSHAQWGEISCIRDKILCELIGKPLDFSQCMVLHKRKNYCRCKNSARNNGRCSHHTDFSILDANGYRRLVKVMYSKLSKTMSSLGNAILPYEDILEKLRVFNEFKCCSHQVKKGKEFQLCKAFRYNELYCKKHMKLNERRKTRQCKKVGKANSAKTPMFTQSTNLHRIGLLIDGIECCYCCRKSIDELKRLTPSEERTPDVSGV